MYDFTTLTTTYPTITATNASDLADTITYLSNGLANVDFNPARDLRAFEFAVGTADPQGRLDQVVRNLEPLPTSSRRRAGRLWPAVALWQRYLHRHPIDLWQSARRRQSDSARPSPTPSRPFDGWFGGRRQCRANQRAQ